MSKWTHVSGLLRYDDLRSVLLQATANTDFLDKYPLPTGSEGPLVLERLRSTANDFDGYSYMATVALYGDLRDFSDEDVPALASWLRRACNPPVGVGVRMASILAECEYGSTYSLLWNSGTGDVDTTVLRVAPRE